MFGKTEYKKAIISFSSMMNTEGNGFCLVSDFPA
jgi:hypothetical protein